MGSKIWTFVNWGFLLIVVFITFWMVWGSYFQNADKSDDFSLPDAECVDVNKLDGLGYDACYDPTSENIFLKVSRERDNYNIRKIDVSFVDLSSQSRVLEDIPRAGESRAYSISANKNPNSISLGLEVVRDFSGSVCSSKNVFVDYCPVGTGGQGVNVSINSVGGVGFNDYIEVSDMADFDSDIVVMDLVEKEKVWESACKSNWDCGDWGECVGGLRRRSCEDLNHCFVSTESPITVQGCDGSCVEDWECEWSSCDDGFSTPKCRDSNDCGTSYDIPKKLACDDVGSCEPLVSCGEWSECKVDYNFLDLVGDVGKVTNIDGSRSRLCVDENKCIANQKEEESCSVSVDVYTKRFERCGDNYIGVYNIMDDSVLAILKMGMKEGSYLDIYFDEPSGVYCDYCFDDVMDGDETGVDCGGSCKACEALKYEKKSWWEYLW